MEEKFKKMKLIKWDSEYMLDERNFMFECSLNYQKLDKKLNKVSSH